MSRSRAHDPNRHRDYRRAAWKAFRSEVSDAGRSELWRYTADMLYLIENPIVREAFFPSGARALTVEPASEEDTDVIVRIARRHAEPEAMDLLRYWWRIRSSRRGSSTWPGTVRTPATPCSSDAGSPGTTASRLRPSRPPAGWRRSRRD